MKSLSFLLLAFFFLQSCSKDTEPSPEPPIVIEPVLPDTLGTSWTKVTGFKQDFYDIVFASNTIGYVLGDSGLYKSTDGGVNWKLVSAAIAGDEFLSIASESNIFSVMHDTLFKSFDGGVTFSKHVFDSFAISKPFFINGTVGYLAGAGSNRLYKTTDGGKQWLPVSNVNGLNLSNSHFFPFFINENLGWVSNGSTVYYIDDSFNKWQPVAAVPGVYEETTVPFAVDEHTIFISNRSRADGTTGIYKSADGGKNFQKMAQLSAPKLGWPDIYFADANNGYVTVGTKIYETADGGATWNTIVSMGNNTIIEVYFTDSNHGWACGENGTLLVMKK